MIENSHNKSIRLASSAVVNGDLGIIDGATPREQYQDPKASSPHALIVAQIEWYFW